MHLPHHDTLPSGKIVFIWTKQVRFVRLGPNSIGDQKKALRWEWGLENVEVLVPNFMRHVE